MLIGPYGKNVSKCFFTETTWTVETKLPRNDHWKVLYKVSVFYADRKSKMAATTGHRLTLDPMGKYSNAFFSETTNMINNIGPYVKNVSKCFFSETTWTVETKLPRNDHWKVLYKLSVFYADRKSKMAATAGHRLTLDPMGKYSNAFFSETTNMIKAKLYMNVHWMVLYNLKVFCSDMKFKMAATAGLSLTLDPMGKMFQNASSLKPLGQLKPNCPGMIIGRSSTKFLFFMPIGNPRWPPPQYVD